MNLIAHSHRPLSLYYVFPEYSHERMPIDGSYSSLFSWKMPQVSPSEVSWAGAPKSALGSSNKHDGTPELGWLPFSSIARGKGP